MARIRLPTATDATGSARGVLEEATSRWGFEPNIVRALALRPEILAAEDVWSSAVMYGGILPRGLKEGVATVVSSSNKTTYCFTSHAMQAEREGVPASAIDGCIRFDFESFDDAERTALSFARKAAADMHAITDEDMAALREHYSSEEIVELVAVIGSFMLYNTFVTVLGLELEPEQTSRAAAAGLDAAPA
ncbi:MAG: carboxymuconolactone decarboxylase family protein [Thermoplasmatota archaeon]